MTYQYLGFRYHGWQKQPDVKTVQKMLDKTFSYVLGKAVDIKFITSSRTDAMVSASHATASLFVNVQLDLEDLIDTVNFNLPPDIRVLDIKEVSPAFNAVQDVVAKEYHYLFSEGNKNHPFAASLMMSFSSLDLSAMNDAASVFVGSHSFHNYTDKRVEKSSYVREVFSSDIVVNSMYQANFFPEKSYLFRVRGRGFLRYQVRKMMGALVLVGKGLITKNDLKRSLDFDSKDDFKELAPASGLILHQVVLSEDM